jgi:uncharacterized protein (DUF2336 family)
MAVSPDTEMQDLLDLARDKSASGKSQLAQVVGDLFFEGGRVLNERERTLMTDFLRQLIQDVEISVRKALADRMAEESRAPRDLINILANDELDVAHNILLNSQVLQDLELIEIIQHQTFEHQLTIAMRDKISEAVGGRGEIDTRSLKQTSHLAQKLADKQAITPQVLFQTLRRDEVRMFEGMFAQLTGLWHNLVRRIFFKPGGEGLAIACKAIGMLKPDFAAPCSCLADQPAQETKSSTRVRFRASLPSLTICARIQRKKSSVAGNSILIICLH